MRVGDKSKGAGQQIYQTYEIVQKYQIIAYYIGF